MPVEAATVWAGEVAAIDAAAAAGAAGVAVAARAAWWATEMAERHLAVGTGTSWHGCACCWTA